MPVAYGGQERIVPFNLNPPPLRDVGPRAVLVVPSDHLHLPGCGGRMGCVSTQVEQSIGSPRLPGLC